MANRNFDQAYAMGKRLVEITGSFVPLTGSGTIVASKVKGFGFGYAPVAGVMALRAQPQQNPTPLTTPGIVRTSTGLYTVTFEDPYLDVNFASCDMAAPNTGSALWAQPVEPVSGVATANTGPSVQFLIINSAGTPTDASANMRLYFSVQFRDSTVEFGKP